MLFNMKDSVEAPNLESHNQIQAARALASSEPGKSGSPSDTAVPEPPEPVPVPLSQTEEAEILNSLNEVLESERKVKEAASEAPSMQPTPQPLPPPAPGVSSPDPSEVPVEKMEPAAAAAGDAGACASAASASVAPSPAPSINTFFDPKTYKGRTVGLPPLGPPHVMTDLTQDNINRFFCPSTYGKNRKVGKDLREGDGDNCGSEALSSDRAAIPVSNETPHGPHGEISETHMEAEVDVAVAGQGSTQPESAETGRNPSPADGEKGDCGPKPDTCPDTLIDTAEVQTQEVPVPHSADRSDKPDKPAAPGPVESATQELRELPQVPHMARAAQSSEVHEDLAQSDQSGIRSASSAALAQDRAHAETMTMGPSASSSSSEITEQRSSNAQGSSSCVQSFGPRNRGIVKSLDECMKFWEDCLFKLDETDEIQTLMNSLQDDTFSTAFSGQFAWPVFQKKYHGIRNSCCCCFYLSGFETVTVIGDQ